MEYFVPFIHRKTEIRFEDLRLESKEPTGRWLPVDHSMIVLNRRSFDEEEEEEKKKKTKKKKKKKKVEKEEEEKKEPIMEEEQKTEEPALERKITISDRIATPII